MMKTFKTRSFLALLLCILACRVMANRFVLIWDPSTSVVANYSLYIFTTTNLSTSTYYSRMDVGTNLYAQIDLEPGRWYCAATCQDINGYESDFSNMLTLDVFTNTVTIHTLNITNLVIGP